jgi:hypothetical protein
MSVFIMLLLKCIKQQQHKNYTTINNNTNKNIYICFFLKTLNFMPYYTHSLAWDTLQARMIEVRANPPARQPSTMRTTLLVSSSEEVDGVVFPLFPDGELV